MKSFKNLLLAGAIATSILLTSQATAGDKTPVMSPKARQLQDSLRRHPGEDIDMLDRSVNGLPPKQSALQASLRRSSVREKDMLVRNAISGNARLWANAGAKVPTWGEPVYLAPSK